MNKFFSKLKINKTHKSLKSSKVINPHHHWIVLIWIFIFTTSVLIIFSLYLLYKIKNEQIFKVKETNVQVVNPIREKLLKSVMEFFDQKAAEEKKIKDSTITYEDPSL